MKSFYNSIGDRILKHTNCIEQYLNGASMLKLSKEFGVSGHTIRRYLDKNNISVRTQSEQVIGEGNPFWKGDNVGYGALHDYVRSKKAKPILCEDCKTTKYQLDLANISGEYKRDLSDWEYICRKCHMNKDGRMTKLIERNRNGIQATK